MRTPLASFNDYISEEHCDRVVVSSLAPLYDRLDYLLSLTADYASTGALSQEHHLDFHIGIINLIRLNRGWTIDKVSTAIKEILSASLRDMILSEFDWYSTPDGNPPEPAASFHSLASRKFENIGRGEMERLGIEESIEFVYCWAIDHIAYIINKACLGNNNCVCYVELFDLKTTPVIEDFAIHFGGDIDKVKLEYFSNRGIRPVKSVNELLDDFNFEIERLFGATKSLVESDRLKALVTERLSHYLR